MLFILLFIAGGSAVPFAWDLTKHGNRNIVLRAGKELTEYAPVRSVLRRLRLGVDTGKAAVASISGVGLLVVIGYFLLRLGVTVLSTLIR